MCQHFERLFANYWCFGANANCCKWPNIEHVIKPGHTVDQSDCSKVQRKDFFNYFSLFAGIRTNIFVKDIFKSQKVALQKPTRLPPFDKFWISFFLRFLHPFSRRFKTGSESVRHKIWRSAVSRNESREKFIKRRKLKKLSRSKLKRGIIYKI